MRKCALRVIPLILVLFLCAITYPALAQDKPTPAPADPSRPFADVPDAFFTEADDFIKSCEANTTMSQYYNCDCMGFEYLNARIKDPKANQSQIVQSINQKCIDATEAAGTEYDRCMGNAPMLPIDVKPEDYCKCYASTYAKLFERYKAAVSSRVIVELQTQAYVSCTDPQLSKRLFPYLQPEQQP